MLSLPMLSLPMLSLRMLSLRMLSLPMLVRRTRSRMPNRPPWNLT